MYIVYACSAIELHAKIGAEYRNRTCVSSLEDLGTTTMPIPLWWTMRDSNPRLLYAKQEYSPYTNRPRVQTGSGGWTRTIDLKFMRLPRCLCATPQNSNRGRIFIFLRRANLPRYVTVTPVFLLYQIRCTRTGDGFMYLTPVDSATSARFLLFREFPLKFSHLPFFAFDPGEV